MKTEFSLAFNEIMERSGLSRDTVMEALEAAMVSAFRRSVNASSAQGIEAHIDDATGEPRVFVEKEVVESVENSLTEVPLEAAREVDAEVEVGSVLLIDSTPPNFGRVAAQTAKQVILQRLREAERDAQYEEYVEREGDMVHGTVHSVTSQAVTIGLGRAEAILPRNQQIPGEHFRVRDRVRVYVLEVRKSSRGPVIVVSRSHPHMLRRLLEMEVPEINQGLVEIKSIAREAGKRAKVAVAAMRDNVDPVGACVGLRGVRIQSIVRDLNDEKIDVIEWNPDPPAFIAKALSPARVSGVYLDEEPDRGKTAVVVVPEDQLSLAIGRAGVNARLAAKLTGWRIDIKSLPEAAAESLRILKSDDLFSELAKEEAETIELVEATLTKKAENRPIPPEEYKTLTAFVNRIQGTIATERDAARQHMRARLKEIRAQIPPSAYQTSLQDVELSARVLRLLSEAEYETAGRVMEQLELDEDKILALQGFGPKGLVELRKTLKNFEFPEIVVEEEPELEAGELAEIEEIEGAEPAEVSEDVAEVVEAEGAEAEAAPAEQVKESEPDKEETGTDTDEKPEPLVPETEADLEKAFAGFAEKLRIPDVKEKEKTKTLEELPSIEQETQEKKQKFERRIVEFDPDSGENIVTIRRKRDQDDDWEEYEP
ncbi:MAG: transcription termination/antitermination protein NusA [Chloroflexi bacterium]|nr:transcription termination/antitermination protein NusA [Chloroflexota bacterium]